MSFRGNSLLPNPETRLPLTIKARVRHHTFGVYQDARVEEDVPLLLGEGPDAVRGWTLAGVILHDCGAKQEGKAEFMLVEQGCGDHLRGQDNR